VAVGCKFRDESCRLGVDDFLLMKDVASFL
jgi:hypothetical protein